MFWLFPAIAGAASTIGGAAKAHSDNAEYDRQMGNRKRRSYFAAFTGDNPNATPEPEKPSTARTVLGGAISGAGAGVGLGLGLQQLMKNEAALKMPEFMQNPTELVNPYTSMPQYMIPAQTRFQVNPQYMNPFGGY